jgi:predicted DNA repair protein MutK
MLLLFSIDPIPFLPLIVIGGIYLFVKLIKMPHHFEKIKKQGALITVEKKDNEEKFDPKELYKVLIRIAVILIVFGGIIIAAKWILR